MVERRAQNLAAEGWFRTEPQPDALHLVFGGDWLVGDVARLDRPMRDLAFGDSRTLVFDGAALHRLDSAGAWLLLRAKRRAEAEGRKVVRFTLPDAYLPLLETLERDHDAPPVDRSERHTFKAFLGRTGYGCVHTLSQGRELLGFLGLVTFETIETIIQPRRRLRLAALVHQMEETGVTALPILGLLSFLLGVVLAYQGADQLRRFGAEIFTVNLIGVAILREVGGLIAAIIVAGRSGSAFTAQIGTMKVNEEIDAMETLGLNTIEVLVLPRVLGLMVTLPLLTLYANVMGLVGGGVMAYFDLGVTIPVFMRQLQSAVTISTFWVGLIKAPVFAFLIGLVGCFEGLRVERNAASVGKLTTRAVVESIFLVIVFDAGFSILFSILGL